MALVSIFPAINAVVYDFDGDPILPVGIQVTWSPFYANLLRAGLILFDDPLEQLTAAAASETLTGSQITSTTMEDLRVRVGAFDGAIAHTSGYDDVYPGGGLVYRWELGSAVADDGYYVLGAEASGRWHEQHGRAVSPKVFGATGSGGVSDTAALQAAIDTGFDVDIPAGTYLCCGLTQSTHYQRIYCSDGVAKLTKNANGVILTSTGNYVKFENIEFRGESASPTYTGNNVNLSGTQATLRHCASLFAKARAVLATGDSVTIDGTCSIYQTTDATASGFDIELGISGTATLYHVITGIRSSQSTGGIKLVETGAVSISDSQFGKLTCSKGTVAAGSGGGRIVGNRITGAITTDQASGVWVGNQLGSSAHVTFEAGTSGNIFVANSVAAGCTITNAGNTNNLILKEVSSGGTSELRIGDDSSLAIITSTAASGVFNFPAYVQLENDSGVRIQDSSDAYTASLVMNSGNNLSLANTHASGYLQLYGTLGVQATNYLIRTTSVSVTASGDQTQAAGVALAITADYINIATCAIAGDSIALPPAVAGREVTVTNSGIAACAVFPYTSDNLGAGVNTSISLAAGATARWWAIDSTTWKRIL